MKLTVSDTEVHLFSQKYLDMSLFILVNTFTFSFKVRFIKFTPLFNLSLSNMKKM